MAKMQWGFDITSFGDGKQGAKVFREILEACGLPTKPKRRRPYRADKLIGRVDPLNQRPFVWKTKGLRLVTGNDPLTGRYSRAGQRENELGYASYIGISGDKDSVTKLAKLIAERAEYVKEETPGESRFIG